MKCTGAVLAGLVRFAINIKSRPGDFQRSAAKLTVSSFHEYLSRDHSEDQLRCWAVALSFFRFCRAYGGHGTDGDRFLVTLRYDSESDLVSIADKLGLTFEEWERRTPSNVPLTVDESTSRINDCPSLRQIGHCSILEKRCFTFADSGKFSVSVSGAAGNCFAVTEVDFLAAKEIESSLVALAERVVDPPQDDRNCISPKHYPAFWTNNDESNRLHQ